MRLLKSVQDVWKLGLKLIGSNELLESSDSFSLTEVTLEFKRVVGEECSEVLGCGRELVVILGFNCKF